MGKVELIPEIKTRFVITRGMRKPREVVSVDKHKDLSLAEDYKKEVLRQIIKKDVLVTCHNYGIQHCS